METADFHFEQPWVLAVALIGGLVLFVALCWAERRRRRGLAGFAAARLLDIEFLDHLVIGHGRWVSIRSKQPSIWGAEAP